jgi:transcriptional regulator with XRE-family HTH domain
MNLSNRETRRQLMRSLAALRCLRRWTQEDLATSAAVSPSLICDYEKGTKTPELSTIYRLLAALELPQAALECALELGRLAERAEEGGPAWKQQQEYLALSAGLAMTEFTRSLMELMEPIGPIGDGRLPEPSAADRAAAPDLWSRFELRSPEERQFLLESTPCFRSWSLCELLCHRSVVEAEERPERGLELARIALEIAEWVPGPDAWSRRLQGYSWGHVAHAYRALGDAAAAQAASARVWPLWNEGAWGDPGLLSEDRLRELESSAGRSVHLETDQPESQ